MEYSIKELSELAGVSARTLRYYDENFDMLNAMEEHLRALEKQKKETENLILTVKKTIKFIKGECVMSDKEKFQALKENAVRKNEEMYRAVPNFYVKQYSTGQESKVKNGIQK